MLEYLVPSQSRRTLLKLLFLQEAAGSASQLAEMAGVSFSTAYEELRAMEQAGLAQSEYEGNQVRFRANQNAPQAGALKELLQTDEAPKATGEADAVLFNLERMSGSLGPRTREGKREALSDEETLARALKLTRQNPTVARVYPLALYNHADHLDFEALKAASLKQGEKKTLGFFLDLTSELSHQARFHEMAKDLADRRFKRDESFFLSQPKTKYAKKLESRNTPAVAKRWHFRMNMDLENFRSHFDKFAAQGRA